MKICNNEKCNDHGTTYDDDMMFCPTCNDALDLLYDKSNREKSPKSGLLGKVLIAVVAAAIVAGAGFGISKLVSSKGHNGPGAETTASAAATKGTTAQGTEATSEDDVPWWDIYPTEVSIKGPATIGINETKALTVDYTKPKDVNKKTVLLWESSDTSILEIDSSGKATGHKLGTAEITVTVEGKKGVQITATLSVKVVIPVASIVINGPTSLEQTKSGKLTAVVSPDNATDKKVKWKSSDTSIVTVDGSGNIKAGNIGTAKITATAGEKSATFTVSVTKQIIRVTSISLSGPSSLRRGKTGTLSATVSPANATDKSVTYKSSDSSIVKVDSSGKITALKKGTAKITATADGKSATKSVKVTVPVDSITLSGPSTLGRGDHGYYLSVSVSPSDANKDDITYTSSDASVIRVDSDGEVWAQGRGTAQITVTANGKTSNTISITVNVPVTGISIDYQNISVSEGGTDWFRVNVIPSDADNTGFRVKSENLFVATIYDKDESSGQVTVRGSNAGDARIVVTTDDGGFVDYCYVNVY